MVSNNSILYYKNNSLYADIQKNNELIFFQILFGLLLILKIAKIHSSKIKLNMINNLAILNFSV